MFEIIFFGAAGAIVVVTLIIWHRTNREQTPGPYQKDDMEEESKRKAMKK